MKLITVVGGNLFQIAAAELLDATQWIRIAQLNNLNDPILVGIMVLAIPAINKAAGGGVAPQ